MGVLPLAAEPDAELKLPLPPVPSQHPPGRSDLLSAPFQLPDGSIMATAAWHVASSVIFSSPLAQLFVSVEPNL
jgi:hypothetical protein